MPWPSTAVPFDSVYYTSGFNSASDRVVVGAMSLPTYMALQSQISAPSFTNQLFCGSLQMAPGLFARAYVPTAAEWSGNFSPMAGLLLDPFTGTRPGTYAPFPGGFIPLSRIPTTFAWRINSFLISPTAPLRFIPITPCRIADTREAAGPFGAPMLTSQSTRTFSIPDGPCAIPSNAQAYSLNFTVVPQSKLDYITAYPTGRPRPLASVLNSYDGRIKANSAILPAGTSGGISVFATDSTQLILDIDGYFVPDSNTTALAYYPMTPCRVADTRGTAGSLGAPVMGAGEERVLPVLTSGCGVPAEAQAYALNYTVVPAGPLDYLTTWPSGKPRPLASTLNALTGTITANAAIVSAGDNGAVSVYVTGQTHVIVDINGYFAAPTTRGLSLYTLPPCRLYDSRAVASSSPLINTNVTTVASGSCGAPPIAKTLVVNSTVVPVGPLLYLSLWGDGSNGQPATSVLNAPDGIVTSNMAFIPSRTGAVNAFSSGATHLILDVSGYFAP